MGARALAFCALLLGAHSQRAAAQALATVNFTALVAEVPALETSWGAGLVRDVEAGYRESEIGSDQLRVRVNLENVSDFGERRRAFKELAQVYAKNREVWRGQELAQLYHQLLDHLEARELHAHLTSYVERLQRAKQLAPRGEVSAKGLVVLESQLDKLQREAAELAQTRDLLALELKERGIVVGEASSTSLVGPREILAKLRAGSVRARSSSEALLAGELKLLHFEEALKRSQEKSILGHVELQRRISDGARQVDHAVAVGVTIPWVGDDSARLTRVLSTTAKRARLLRELSEARLAYRQLRSSTESLAQELLRSPARSKLRAQALRAQALGELSLETMLADLSRELEAQREGILLRWQLMKNHITLLFEEGELAQNPNQLVRR